MKNKIILLASFIFTSINISKAQTDVDALRYSGSSISGTSRFNSMSGAFGATGGDFSSLSYNPAGIAIYRKSEFTFTPSIFVGGTTSEFLGKSFDESKYNFNIGNLGLVFTRSLTNDQESPGWKSYNFGIGYNRLNNFQSEAFYEGLNPSNSLGDNFAENSNGIAPENLDAFYEQLAFDTYVIDTSSGNNYFSQIPDGNVIQRRTLESRGGSGEVVFSFGGNYSNKLFLGATLGLTTLRYLESTTYEERFSDTSASRLNNYKFQQDLTTRGNGVNFKVGMIYKANDFVRFGAAIQTPTWITMHDDFKTSLSSDFIDSTFDAESPDGSFDYDLITPFKASAGFAVIFNKSGLFNVDYEFSDYSEARFDAPENPFSDVNNLIRNKYMAVHTVRAGAEFLVQNISLRAGGTYSTSPLKKEFTTGSSDFTKKGFSAGIGFRENNLFFDLGYSYSVSDQFFQPYTLSYEDVPGVNTQIRTNTFTATFGVKF